MNEKQLIRKISLIDREIKYYKNVYSKNSNKILELLNKRKHYSRQLNKQLA